MRIAMFTNNYKPFIGGVPISIERLANGLRERGHIVYVFAPTYKNQVEEEFVIRYKSYKKRNLDDTKFIIPNVLDGNIEKKFSELKFDIIHVHQPMLMGNIAHHLSKKYDVPVALTYHTRYEYYLHHIKPYRLLEEKYETCDKERIRELQGRVLKYTRESFVPNYMKKFINKCDLVFSPTNLIKDYLEEDLMVESEVRVMPTGLDKSFFNGSKENTSEIRNRYIGNKKHLFCTVSRLSYEKNIDFLLEGIKNLKDKVGDTFNVMIIGDGPQREEIMEKAEELNLCDNAIFLNSISNSEIGDYYRAADLFLFASKSETQGIVLLEAMAAKTPIIAIEATGVADVVKNGINGFMTNEDLDAWTERAIYLINNDEAMEKCRAGSYETAEEYSVPNIAAYAESSYREAIIKHYKEIFNMDDMPAGMQYR